MSLFNIFKKKTPPPPADITPTPTRKGFYSLQVAQVVSETTDAVSIYFDIPPHLKTVFSYQPGQYVTLRTNVNEMPYLRCYSLSSCPYSDTYFRIAVKAKKGGKVSGNLVANCRQGMQIEVFTPLGNFIPPLDTTAQFVLYGGGSGITPLLSIAKSVLYCQPDSRVTLLYANRNQTTIIYAQELAQLEAQYDSRFSVYHVLEETGTDSHALHGIFSDKDYADWVSRSISDADQALHFICGPEGMMQAVKRGLTDIAHIPTTNIHLESFDFSQQNTDSHPPHTHSHTTAPIEGGNITTAATITLQRKKHQLNIAPDTTILTACLDSGIDAPYMCEAGVCSSCRAKLVTGKVDMQVCYALSDQEIADGFILTCQAIPKSDTIEVSYDI